MLLPTGTSVRIHIAAGVTDMRKGMDGLAMLVERVLREDPFSGHLFAFRGRKANLIKIVFWDGNGLCLFTKRLDQGSFVWPVMAGYDGRIGRHLDPVYFGRVDGWRVHSGPIYQSAEEGPPPTLTADALHLSKDESSSVIVYLMPDLTVSSYWQGD